MKNLPVWLQRFLARITPVPRVQKVRKIVETLQRNSEALYEKKKQALLKGDAEEEAQVGSGKDVMSILSTSCPCLFRECVADLWG